MSIETPDHEREMTAYHEAGHALADACWTSNRVEFITIAPNETALGHVRARRQFLPDSVARRPLDERRAYARGEVRASLAGYAGEQVCGPSGGLPADLRELRSGVLVLADLDPGHDLSQAAAWIFMAYREGGENVRRLFNDYVFALGFLEGHRPLLDHVAGALLERETLSAGAFHEIVNLHSKRTPRGWNPTPWAIRPRVRRGTQEPA